MVQYDLSHLTQSPSQDVVGPIQDDEALFLYSIVRGARLRSVLEIGGLSGYSARNFLRAMAPDLRGTVVFTVDINPTVPKLQPNHVVIIKDARDLTPEDVGHRCIELVFFDCHDYDVQMDIYHKLVDRGIIDDNTVIALHDTNTHPFKLVPWAYPVKDEGWVHQRAERSMANTFKNMGYDVFCLHTRPDRHNCDFNDLAGSCIVPYRHGVTVCRKFTRLTI